MRSYAKFAAVCAVSLCLFQGGDAGKALKHGASAPKHVAHAPKQVAHAHEHVAHARKPVAHAHVHVERAHKPVAHAHKLVAHAHKHAASAVCAQTVSSGDAAVGIKIVTDASCVSGGVGCIDDVCRFCKAKDTIQSSHLVDCGSIGSTPAPTTAAPVTAAPVTTAPVVTTAPSDAQCATSSGDYAVGIQGIYDASCAKGGLGCASDVCRHCKWKSTPQSSHLLDCSTFAQPTSAPTTTAPATSAPAATSPPVVVSDPPATFAPSDVIDTECPWAVSEGDAAVGIQLVGDATCVTGGVGCYQDICRYCKYKETDASKHLTSCLDLGFDFSGAPYDPTDDEVVDPTTAPAPTTTSAPVATAAPGTTGCGFTVSPGDFAVGIQLVGDATCVTGGVGCYEDVCRYCKFHETPQSSHLVACADLGYDLSATSAPATESPASESPMTITPPGTGVEGTGCPFPITDGDYAVGIQLVGDVSCISGGVGCYEDICRYCKYQETPQSSHLFSCADLGYTFDVTFQPTDDGGDVSTPAPTTDAPVPGTGCPFPITEGDYAVGIQLVGDATCANGGVGCHENVCRYCKFKESTQSSHLMACRDLGFLFGDEGDDGEGPTTPPTTPPTAIEETRCPYPVSEGDFAVGIQLVGDETCANGGIGCYEGICRYCKYEETPQSSHLVACVDVGYGFTPAPTFKPTDDETPEPTPAPTEIPGTGCPFPITEGDYSVGIHLVGDESCAWGGVGCYQEVCRYCSYKTTPQSSHLLKCKDLGYDFGGPDDDLTPEPTTAAPPTAAPTPIPETDCIYPATEGDVAVGIQLVGDATCAAGGVGCYEGVCRYCKFAETAQSKHLLACVDLGYSFTPAPTFKPSDDSTAGETDAPTPAPTEIPDTGCPFPVSKGDYAVGIHLVGDETCATGGIGCFENVCRFCMFHTTPQSSHLIPCKDLGYDFGDDVVEPTTAPTPEPTPEPTPIPEPIDETGCPYPVSEGDEAVGIQLVGDETCVNGGLGCYEGICRYCKFAESAESSHLVACSDLGYSFTVAPTFKPSEDSQEGSNDDGDNDLTEAPEPSTESPAPTTEAPAPTTEAPAPTTEAPTPAPTPVDTKCAFQVSDGDKSVGIQLVGDATCASGGLGCFADVCRFCKVHTTAQSAHLLSCKDLGYNFDGADSGPEPTTAPTPVPEPIEGTGCPYPISEGDFAVGIQLVGDETCANGGLGCYEGVCRYCKYSETAQSSHLLPCADFGYPKDEPTFKPTDDETPAPAPTPATPIPGTGCVYPITEGDYAVGIQLVGDATCTEGSFGCYEGVCRYCQFKSTDKSSHLVPCSDLGYNFGGGSTPAPEPSTDSPVVDPVPTTCPLSVSEGDFAVGIQLITDASCVSGGLGCLAEVCRFCKFRDTPSSTHLLDCADFGAEPTEPPYTTSPTATPPAPATCEFSASEGDLAVGIQVIPDDSCVNGGLGCFADVCRYCKVFNTDKSSHLDDCSKYISIDVTDTTDEPLPTPSGPTCGSSASDRDKNVGIEMVTDLSCASETPGIGCVDNSVCRFCKSFETPASNHLNWCAGIETPAPGPAPVTDAPAPVTDAPAPVTDAPGPVTDAPATTPAPGPVVTAAPSTGTCGETVSAGDAAAGIGIFADASCLGVAPGVGCLDKTECRLCKNWDSAASSHLVACPSSGATAAPVATTTAPSTDVTSTPSTTAAPSSGAVCSETVSTGDAAVGIDIIADASCPAGVGCIDKTQCRFCKRWESAASSHLSWCATTAAPPADTSAPSPATTVPSTTAAPSGDAHCGETVSAGDASAGIDIIADASCPSGVGCIDNTQCRFCKKWDSAASTHFSWCPTSAGEPAHTEPPIATVAPGTVAPPLSGDCDQEVSEGDAAVGIDMFTDPSCFSDADGIGCIEKTACRLCKRWVTPASGHLQWCVGDGEVPDVTIETPPSDVAPAPTLAPEQCSLEVSEGDSEGGVAAVFDPSCLSTEEDNTGCFGGVCRFCKYFDSEISSHFFECDSYDATITPLRLAAKSHKSVKAAKAAKSVKKSSKKVTKAAKKAAKKSHKDAKKVHKVAHKAAKDIKAIKTVKAAKATTSASEFDELLKDKTFKWAMAGAACVGVAAVLALFALGAKRVVARRSTVVKETTAEPETAEVAETAAVVESEDAAVVAQV